MGRALYRRSLLHRCGSRLRWRVELAGPGACGRGNAAAEPGHHEHPKSTRFFDSGSGAVAISDADQSRISNTDANAGPNADWYIDSGTDTDPGSDAGGAVVSNAIYMGVFDNISNSQPNAAPHPDIANLEAQIGRTEAIDMHYMAWTNIQFMNPVLSGNPASCVIGSCNDLFADKVAGRIPLIAWNCGDTDAHVVAGLDDPLIIASANAIAAYGNPVMVRWFWEMTLLNTDQNRSGSCYDPSYDGVNGNTGRANYFDGVMYARAWQHIWTIFNSMHVTNVVWVWNPGDTAIQDAPLYWPGSSYVDWIAGDIYDRQDIGLAAELDSPPDPIPPPPAPLASAVPYSLYGILSSLDPSKPLFIAENGAHTDWATTGPGSLNQEHYFDSSTFGADYVLRQHPRIHAFDYFDADESFNSVGIPIQPPPEVVNDWDLTGTGLTAYAAFANGAYESLAAVPPPGQAFAPRGILRRANSPVKHP